MPCDCRSALRSPVRAWIWSTWPESGPTGRGGWLLFLAADLVYKVLSLPLELFQGWLPWLLDPEEGAAPEGWDRLRARYAGTGAFVDEVLGYGADVVVLEPDDVRKEVVDQLQALVEATA